jgi:hypothetical protein
LQQGSAVKVGALISSARANARRQGGQAQEFDHLWVHKGHPHSCNSVWLSTGSINTAFC